MLLQLMYPSKNRFARCMRDFMQMQADAPAFEEKYSHEDDNPEPLDLPDFKMGVARFLNTHTLRYLIQTLLVILREYSYCSIANQLCVQIMVTISG